ncbi:protein Hikeshi-like [Saccostrea echinata]|uniref:protein Hikeshi-like n=1 Tax=Saccostrea echinata TaxID=191078 RepID=UPI002A82C1A5|nr:protein Hikeshi-like [Saccostrea echinata]
MFGLIVAGRLVQTDVTQVSENQFLFNIPDADDINHLVIFLTGQIPFPDGFGAAVYFSFPNPQGQSWALLGHITNTKPSAIFKITNIKKSSMINENPFSETMPHVSHMGQVGISVEPLSQLAQQTPEAGTSVSKVDSFVEFSQKMLENFFNYATSFAVTQSQMTPNPSEAYVTLNVVQNWFQNFQRRLQQNPYFWRQ